VYALRSGGAPIDVEKPRLLELEGPVFLGSIEYVRSRLAASGNRKSRADERCSFGKESELESRPRRAAGSLGYWAVLLLLGFSSCKFKKLYSPRKKKFY
jgi:hypothetical protein